MTDRPRALSWWHYALLTGVPFGLLWGLFPLALNDPATHGGVLGYLITALISGTVFGLLTGRIFTRVNRRARLAARIPDQSGLNTALLAVYRGADPADPEARAAARRLAIHELAQLRRLRVRTAAGGVIFVALYVWMGLNASPWWFTCVPVFAALTVFASVIRPRRVERRIAELGDATGSSSLSST